jgi:hypothetical protein
MPRHSAWPGRDASKQPVWRQASARRVPAGQRRRAARATARAACCGAATRRPARRSGRPHTSVSKRFLGSSLAMSGGSTTCLRGRRARQLPAQRAGARAERQRARRERPAASRQLARTCERRACAQPRACTQTRRRSTSLSTGSAASRQRAVAAAGRGRGGGECGEFWRLRLHFRGYMRRAPARRAPAVCSRAKRDGAASKHVCWLCVCARR